MIVQGQLLEEDPGALKRGAGRSGGIIWQGEGFQSQWVRKTQESRFSVNLEGSWSLGPPVSASSTVQTTGEIEILSSWSLVQVQNVKIVLGIF